MEIIAETREKFGKKNKQIRREKKLPAVVFKKGTESISLTIDLIQFTKVFKEVGETSLIDLKIGKDTKKVLVTEVQFDPVTDLPMHANFHEVDLKEKITAEIPVIVTGEEECSVIKNGEGMLLIVLDHIEVEALPTDLPPEFTVDISKLTEVEQTVTVGELEYDKEKVEITEHESDDIVIKIDYAQMAEEPEEEEVSEEEALEAIEVTEESGEREEGEEKEPGKTTEPTEE